MWSAILARANGPVVVYCRIERDAPDAFRVWTGVPGTRGETRTIPLRSDDDALAIMQVEARSALLAGFGRAEVFGLTVECSTAGATPTRAELDERATCERALVAAIEPVGFGTFDGFDSGSGVWGLCFSAVVEPDFAARCARDALAALGFADRTEVKTFDVDHEPDPFYDGVVSRA